MRIKGSSGLAGVLAGLLVVVSGPGPRAAAATAAQPSGVHAAQDTTSQSLIYSIFVGQTGAKRAMDAMKREHPDMRHDVYAVVAKDQQGNIKVQEKRGKVDGLVALLGRAPAGGRMEARAKRAGVSSEDAEKMRSMLTPGSSAIILVVPASEAGAMHSAMEQMKAKQVMEAEVRQP
jgi:hypothetical protein